MKTIAPVVAALSLLIGTACQDEGRPSGNGTLIRSWSPDEQEPITLGFKPCELSADAARKLELPDAHPGAATQGTSPLCNSAQESSILAAVEGNNSDVLIGDSRNFTCEVLIDGTVVHSLAVMGLNLAQNAHAKQAVLERFLDTMDLSKCGKTMIRFVD